VTMVCVMIMVKEYRESLPVVVVDGDDLLLDWIYRCWFILCRCDTLLLLFSGYF
jgi:hypothetical protein